MVRPFRYVEVLIRGLSSVLSSVAVGVQRRRTTTYLEELGEDHKWNFLKTRGTACTIRRGEDGAPYVHSIGRVTMRSHGKGV